jgi:hypothetical protein
MSYSSHHHHHPGPSHPRRGGPAISSPDGHTSFAPYASYPSPHLLAHNPHPYPQPDAYAFSAHRYAPFPVHGPGTLPAGAATGFNQAPMTDYTTRQEAGVQRKRPRYTRSKTGCMTCRRKKVKVRLCVLLRRRRRHSALRLILTDVSFSSSLHFFNFDLTTSMICCNDSVTKASLAVNDA